MTRSKTRLKSLNPLERTVKEKLSKEEILLKTVQQPESNSRSSKTAEQKRVELKKTIIRNVKKKPVATALIYKMVESYTPQQFFDQKADITNGQLLAMNPKFGLTIAKQLRKPVIQKRNEEPNKKVTKNPGDGATGDEGVNEDLLQVNTA
jgi:hypothetical protein